MNKKEIIILLILFLTLSFVYSVIAASRAEPDRLNYWEGETITVTMINEETSNANLNATLPTGFTYMSGCTSDGGKGVSCQNIASGGTDTFIMTAGGAGNYNEYATAQMLTTQNATATEVPMETVDFLRIKDNEIFYTLVEYGRGRGNYFFSSAGDQNLSGSGRSSPGCAYLPNATEFELNFLHKIFNIKQYYGSATQEAENITFYCEYPNKTIVREHLVTSINKVGDYWQVNYGISEIEGSWERMGYLGMHFDDAEYKTGDTITVNCTDIMYQYSPEGNVSVPSDGFTFEIRGREPFTVTASTPSTILNGTQEIEIDYVITNNEQYTASDVVIEIQAPEFSTFIGTRGELWGVGQDKYLFERTEFDPSDSETIRLIARADMTDAPNMNTLALSQGIKIKYITCWEANAYNPLEYTQTISVGNTTNFDLASTATLRSIQEELDYIYNQINITRDELNATISNIDSIVTDIQTTVNYINNTWLPNINNTLGSMWGDITTIYNDVVCTSYTCSAGTNTAPAGSLCNLLCDANLELDCDSSVTGSDDVCDRLDKINDTLVTDINTTLDVINENVLGINVSITANLAVDFTAVLGNISELYNLTEGGFSAVDGNLSLIYDVTNESLDLLNCSTEGGRVIVPETVCDLLHNITSHTEEINTTVWNNFFDLESLINDTWGGITAQDIINNMTGTTIDTQEILTEISKLQEFDEELVFLVTDSFNIQKEAREDMEVGNLGSSMKKLQEANAKLIEASEKLDVIKQGVDKQVQAERRMISNSAGLILAIIMALTLILVFYYKHQKARYRRKIE